MDWTQLGIAGAALGLLYVVVKPLIGAHIRMTERVSESMLAITKSLDEITKGAQKDRERHENMVRTQDERHAQIMERLKGFVPIIALLCCGACWPPASSPKLSDGEIIAQRHVAALEAAGYVVSSTPTSPADIGR